MASKLITLSDDLIQRCEEFGRGVVDAYERGLSNRSLEVSSHNAEKNAKLQALAKMAECAFAIWAGIDPLTSLRWRHSGADPGYDVVFRNARIDVKHTERGSLLIWPYRKTEIFESKPFDVLVLVRGEKPHFMVLRWINKSEFFEKKKVAPCDGWNLYPGTWFLHARHMLDMDMLKCL